MEMADHEIWGAINTHEPVNLTNAQVILGLKRLAPFE
jgi:hypothetical protein